MGDPRRAQAHLFPEQTDRAAIGLDQTRKHLDDRRFARAVLTEQGVRHARLNHETDVVDGKRWTERLAHVLDGDGGLSLLRHSCSPDAAGNRSAVSRDGAWRGPSQRDVIS